MGSEQNQDEMQRRTAACVNAFKGIPTERIAGKNLGEILAGEMRLHGAGPRADGGFGFEFSGGVCQLLAEAYAEQFKQSGAINYLELLFQHSEIGPLTITMQRVEGLTPAQKLAQAEAQRDALAAENAILKNGIGFFSYGSDSGFEEHDSAEKAIAAADSDIDYYRGDACDGWSEETDQTVWGVILQRATMIDERPRSEELPHGSCDFSLLPNVQTPATDAYLNSVRAEGVEIAAKEVDGWVGADLLAFEIRRKAAQLRAGKDGE